MEKLQYIQTIEDIGEELQHYVDQDGERLSAFGPMSRINILVGATNSGKSRFMRGLVKSSSYVQFYLSPSIVHPSSMLSICTRLSRENFHILIKVNPESHNYDPEALTDEFPWMASHLHPTKRGEMPELHLQPADFAEIGRVLRQEITNPSGGTAVQQQRNKLNDLVRAYRFALQTSDHNTVSRKWFNLQKQGITEDTIEIIKIALDFIETFLSSSAKPRKLTRPEIVYIPVLRTAVFLRGVSTSDTRDSLAQSISVNYGLGLVSPEPEVFTGNLLYQIVQQEKSRDPKTHRRLKDFERFLEQNFFEGKSVELKPLDEQYADGRHLSLLIDERTQRQFHDIGDGIQAIIILMYRLFTAKPGTWIFIEEPEQGLHPGLQRIFLKTLVDNPALQEKNLTIFMSTHSNHLLSMAISELEDVSVFAFQRMWTDPEQFQIRAVHTRQQNLLTLLGVANSSVFLANCSIWVEGITDRMYLRAYLSAYLRSDEFEAEYSFIPQEDIHYAFFEYAGSNLAHYLFESEDGAPAHQAEQIRAQFLCNRIFLLADRDENKEKKHKRLEESQSNSFRYFVTPGIEVENLISEIGLSQALPKLISRLTEEDVSREKIRFSDYRNKRIGLYLKETFNDRCPDALKTSSGTLSAYYKDKLSELVCSNVTWENMTEDARTLAKSLYKFIRKHNQTTPELF